MLTTRASRPSGDFIIRSGRVSAALLSCQPPEVESCSPPRAVGVDHYYLRAVAPRLFDERPQMNIVAVNIGAPGDDVLGMAKGLRLAAQLAPHHRDQRLAAGCGANRPV